MTGGWGFLGLRLCWDEGAVGVTDLVWQRHKTPLSQRCLRRWAHVVGKERAPGCRRELLILRSPPHVIGKCRTPQRKHKRRGAFWPLAIL